MLPGASFESGVKRNNLNENTNFCIYCLVLPKNAEKLLYIDVGKNLFVQIITIG